MVRVFVKCIHFYMRQAKNTHRYRDTINQRVVINCDLYWVTATFAKPVRRSLFVIVIN